MRGVQLARSLPSRQRQERTERQLWFPSTLSRMPPEEVERKLAAILSADAVGYSRWNGWGIEGADPCPRGLGQGAQLAHVAAVVRIEAVAAVHAAEGVEQDQVADLPVVAVDELRLGGVLEELN